MLDEVIEMYRYYTFQGAEYMVKHCSLEGKHKIRLTLYVFFLFQDAFIPDERMKGM